jgi:hypothetical protein
MGISRRGFLKLSAGSAILASLSIDLLPAKSYAATLPIRFALTVQLDAE